MDNQQANS